MSEGFILLMKITLCVALIGNLIVTLIEYREIKKKKWYCPKCESSKEEIKE